MIEVIRPGPFATVQDLGRPGLAALGVSRSGAADRASLRLANRLVGNPETAACVEITLGGLVARFTRPALLALTGAVCPVELAGRAVGMNAPLPVPPGAELRVGTPAAGLRGYLAVRGGVDVPPVLGSRATDVLAGLGPDPLRAGDRLPIGIQTAGHPLVDVAPVAQLSAATTLRLVPGPRDDWFRENALNRLCGDPYEVSPDSNRIGLRLHGRKLVRRLPGELPPEPMLPGSLEVPPSGQPILLLVDHPVTGGYPVIAVVDDRDLDRAGQLRPGDAVRFTVSPAGGSG